MNMIPIVIISVPFALGAWFWWIMRGSAGNPKTSTKQKKPPQNATKQSPYTMKNGDVAISFRVGNRYYDETRGRVFECIAVKGKKSRLVAFGGLGTMERDMSLAEDGWGFNKVRVEGGVETCQRGALRADRQATAKEVSADLDFIRRIREQKVVDSKTGVDLGQDRKSSACGCSFPILLIIAGVIYSALK